MKFNKWKWFDLVVADTRFTDKERVVLIWIVTKAVLNGKDTFCKRQDTVVARTATSERTVRRAYHRARELGYMVLATERQRGRGHKRADEYRLVIPAKSPEIPATPGQEYRPALAENTGQIELDKHPLNSENAVPLSSLEKSLGEGTGPPLPAPFIGPYGPRCRKHLNVEIPPDCRPCGLERERKEAIDKAEAERIAAEKRAIRAAMDSCPNKCDQAGRLDDLSDCPLHPNFRQKGVA